jgi:hypothetical protein
LVLFTRVRGSEIVPLYIAIAVLRYHLWDVDVTLNRPLVHGALSAMLAAVFAITDTLLLPLLVPSILGEEDASLNAVISAVIIAVLFEPLSRRIKRASIDSSTGLLAMISRAIRPGDHVGPALLYLPVLISPV